MDAVTDTDRKTAAAMVAHEDLAEVVGRFVCRMFHEQMTGPLPSGHYECLECLRRYPVPWGRP